MPLVYVCPKCSAASALAATEPAACKGCGAHAPREAMPTIQLARDREMPRLFHAIIVAAAVIAGLHFVGFGSVVIPFGRDSNWEAAGFNPLHQILTSGLIGLFFLAIALGLHWERPWGRHLAVLGWVAFCLYGSRNAYYRFHLNANQSRSAWLASAFAIACFAGLSISGIWYIYFRARTRAYVRAIAKIPRNPTIAPAVPSGPGPAPPPALQT